MEIEVQAPQAAPSIRGRLKSLFSEMRATFKESGFKGVLKRYGWKLVAGVFIYYLVRDSILYIIIPWMIAKHFLSS